LRTGTNDTVVSQRILVVDDDPRICRLLRRYLEKESYRVDIANGSQAMWRSLKSKSYNLIILDLRLPGGEDGLSLARRLRTQTDISLIMLTGRSNSADKIVGLEMGADDYITKPFDRRELLARIRSVLRRAELRGNPRSMGDRDNDVMEFGGWTLDMNRRELTTTDGAPVELTSYEFDLLAAMVQRPARVLSRDQILDLIAHRDWQPLDRSIDVLIGKLRRKLNDDPSNPNLIKTIRGVGYMFAPPIERV
jgi:two-component system, OmpR family, response regulator